MKGKTVLGTGTLSGGTATFMTSTLKVGTNSITAVYGGDSNFAGSKSKAVKQVVEKAVE
jgi:Bacterial Ig-like domain (group 3)